MDDPTVLALAAALIGLASAAAAWLRADALHKRATQHSERIDIACERRIHALETMMLRRARGRRKGERAG